MSKLLRIAVATSFLAGLMVASAADDKPDPTAVLDKGIKALGGEEKLAKLKAYSWTGKGKFYGPSDATIDFKGEWAVQLPDRLRVALEAERDSIPFKQVRVLSGDKGWLKLGTEDAKEMDKDQVAEEKKQLAGQMMALLLPLKDKDIKLAALADTKVGDQAASVLEATRDGRKFSLFFDKGTGLLLKTESQVKDARAGREVKQELLYSDYKEVNGLKKAMKMLVKRAGKNYLEVEVSDFKPAEKLDDKVFSKP